jgi:hypothetical protein
MSARKTEYVLQLKRKMHYSIPFIKEKSYIGARIISYDFSKLYILFSKDPGIAFLLARFYIKNHDNPIDDYYKEICNTYGCANKVSAREIRLALSE